MTSRSGPAERRRCPLSVGYAKAAGLWQRFSGRRVSGTHANTSLAPQVFPDALCPVHAGRPVLDCRAPNEWIASLFGAEEKDVGTLHGREDTTLVHVIAIVLGAWVVVVAHTAGAFFAT